MKVINNTDYTTGSLKKLFTKCLLADEKEEGRLKQRDYLKVYVEWAKQNRGTSGRAGYHSSWMKLFLIKNNYAGRNFYCKEEDIAYVFLHELAHVRGYKHGQFSEIVLEAMAKEIVGDFRLEKKQPKPEKPKPDIQIVRYGKAKANLQKAKTRLKRAKTLFNKWNQKVRYYEKVFANKK